MKRAGCAVYAICVFAANLFAAEDLFELVGLADSASIVLSENAEPTSRLAAEELSEYVFKASGRRLPIVQKPTSGLQIRIGTLDVFPGEVPSDARKALSNCTKFEAGWTGIDNGILYFVGKEMMGETYAVYRFLEEYIGIRWFKAATKEDPGEYVPPRKERIALVPFVSCREPDFAQRMLVEVCSRQGMPSTNGMNCVTRNGWQAMPGLWPYSAHPGKYDEARRYHEARMNPRLRNNGGGHCLFEKAISKDEFEDHPEYFAFVNGKRVKGDMYCMSNPIVRQRVADSLISANVSCGGSGFAILELADYVSGNCECDACRAMDGDGGLGSGRSQRFFKVMNDIKARIRKVRPDMRFMSYAYQDYRKMPEGVEIDPEDLILYCTHGRSMVHPIDDPAAPENVRQFNEVKEWREMVRDVGMREYMTCSHINYRPVEYLVSKDIKTYRKEGLAGLWEEMVYTDSPIFPEWNDLENRERQESSWRYFYVAGHMLWNADLDVEALLADADSKFYGNAYPPMAKYHALRRKVWEETPGQYGYAASDERTQYLLGIGDTKDRLLNYLAEAERLVADDEIRAGRVAFDRHCLEEYWGKPHEMLRKLADKGLRAPVKTEAGWSSACYEDSFQEMKKGFPVEGKFAPPELRTYVGFLCDSSNIYIRLQAKEPSPEMMRMATEKDGPVWGDDGFELFLFPPSVENAYAHIAVNALGTVYDARCPGNKTDFDYGVTAVGTIEKDRYSIDVTVPAEKLMKIRPGDVWRVCVARRRTIRDALTPDDDGVWSLHGVRKHRPAWMVALELGAGNCISNGSFENGEKGWGKVRVVPVESGKALKLLAGEVVSGYFGGALRRGSAAKRFRWTFRAKGDGCIHCARVAFTDTPDKNSKLGYARKMHPLKSLTEGTLTPTWQTFSGVSETLPDAQNGIRFTADKETSEALIDDVVVVPAE